MTLARHEVYDVFMNEARKKKIDAYLEEITAVNRKYQLKLVAIMQYTEQGTFPRIVTEDIIPTVEKKEEPKPPEPEQPKKQEVEPTS